MESVDPFKVPMAELSSGASMPMIGLGTFGSDHASAEKIADAVRGALSVGYRHLDCASVYQNEPEIGEALAGVFSTGLLKREDIWITSKVWNDMHGSGDVIRSCKKSLKDLGIEYLDLYLVHWPFRNFHPPGCDKSSRSPDAKPYNHENYMETWSQMEQLQREGLVRHIGTSNMTIPKLELLLRDAAIQPACCELELHPHFQQSDLFSYLKEHSIQPIGFSPLGSPNRPLRDREPGDTEPLSDPVIMNIAEDHEIHPALVCLKWAVQRGQVPIPFSTDRRKYLSNLQAVTEDPLTDMEMEDIAGIDRNCRLIKGHVFLWEGAKGWQELWDEPC